MFTVSVVLAFVCVCVCVWRVWYFSRIRILSRAHVGHAQAYRVASFSYCDIFSFGLLHLCVRIVVLQVCGVYRRVWFAVFQFSYALCLFKKSMFAMHDKNHCGSVFFL